MDKLKWEIVEYPIADFAPAGKVITQRDVLEKYKAEHPDDEVKTFAGFKCDQQNKTVSIRIGIADNTVTADSPKLPQPEYDELQQELNKTGLTLLDAVKEVGELKEQLLELRYRYDNLIEAVGEDAQKFSTMLVENNKLKDENKELNFDCDNLIKVSCELGDEIDEKTQKFSAMLVENENLKKQVTALAECAEIDLDSADLVEAKKAIAEGGGISLDEVEDAVENQEPVTNEVDMPEGELDDGTPDCCSDGTVPEDNENE